MDFKLVEVTQEMPDMEKVIKGLEEISDYFFDIYRNDTDSYKCAKAQGYSDCAIDAIALLKEQEAVEPKHNPLSPTDWFCGKCGMCISRFHDYCPSCGQAVKWG